MQPDRNTAPLAIMAVLLLVVSVGVLVSQTNADDLTVPDIAGAIDGDDAPSSSQSPADAGGNASEPGTDGASDPADGPDPDATDATDGTTSGDGNDPDGVSPSDGVVDSSEDPVDGDVGANGLSQPASGTYTYASEGTWGLSTDVMNTLPSTAEAVVTRGADSWVVLLTAGDRYADGTQFSATARGLDWVTWTIERTFQSGRSSTRYVCENDEPFHVADNAKGRKATHVCQAGGGQITSTGTMVTQAPTTIALGDGSSVKAVHVIYDSVDSGEGVSGGGRIEMWLHPGTGLRLKETRDLDSRQVDAQGTVYVYTENVSFLLHSLTPAA